MKFIFDTSAIIALLRNEPGSRVVEKIVLTASGGFIHTVNYVELYYRMARYGGVTAGEQAVKHLQQLRISVTDISGEKFLKRIGHLKITYPALSLGDCYAVGLSEWLSGTVVTSDKRFSDASEYTQVKQIR